MKASADDGQYFPFSAVERGCRRSLTRWLADDRLRRYVRAPVLRQQSTVD